MQILDGRAWKSKYGEALQNVGCEKMELDCRRERSEEAMQKRRGDAIVGVRLPRLEILCYNLICGAGTAALIRICARVFSKGPVSVGT
jgi:hypothetical protein